MNAPVQFALYDPASLYSIEVEQEILGAILHAGGVVIDAVDRIITATDFHEPVHKKLYAGFVDAHSKGRAITLTLAIAALGADGRMELMEGVTTGQYVARLAANAALPGRAVDYAKQILEFAQRRKIVGVMDAMQGGIVANHDPADIAGTGIEALDEIVSTNTSVTTSRMDIGEASYVAVERMTEAMRNPGKITGISTGLSDIDAATGGLHRGELLILGARPGMGKTALGACIARSIAEAQVPTLFFSQEMTAPSLAFRVLADMCFDHRDPLEYFKITKGEITADQGQRVVEAQRRLRSLPLEIDQQDGLTISQIATRARKRNLQLARKGQRLGVIIVDHLHLIRASARYSGNRVGEVTEISGGLKSLAKELDVAVVALAQLNRALEAREMKRPTLADLRDSGSIEQDADTIIFLFREAYYLKDPISNDQAEEDKRIGRLMQVQHDLEANIAKQRSGPVGAIRLFCNIGANAIRNSGRSQ
jgi:replicative DNA helicase